MTEIVDWTKLSPEEKAAVSKAEKTFGYFS